MHDNSSLNFLKIVGTFIIALLHFIGRCGITAQAWACFVDMFFVISGLLLAATFEKKHLSIKRYIITRYKRIWPHFIFGFIVYFACLFVKAYPEFTTWGGIAIHSIPEFFLLQCLAVGEFSTNHGAVWYLSILMVVSVLLYWILQSSFKQIFLRYIAPIIVVVLAVMQWLFFGTIITVWNSEWGLIGNPSFYRGLCDMTAGVLIFYYSQYLREKIPKLVSGKSIQWLEMTLLFVVIICSFYVDLSILYFVLFIIIIIIACNSNHSWLMYNNFYNYAAKYTLSIYINHAIFVDSGVSDSKDGVW